MVSQVSRPIRAWLVGACWCALIALGVPAGQPAAKILLSPGPGDQQTPPQAGQAPAQAQQPQRPTFRTGVNFVRVDVIVTDKAGDPVTDLTQADFEVFEDGKLQTIETFKLVETTGQPRSGGELPREIRTPYEEEYEASREDVRLFVIFFDDYHVRLGNSLAVRQPLINFVMNALGPLDLVGLMYPLTPVDTIKLSRNREMTADAINRFLGRKYDYTPRNEFEDRYAMYPAEAVERIRNQVSLSALESLVTHLGSLREGRKAVILVSEGYTSLLPPQLRDPVASFPGVGNPNRGRPLAGEGDLNEERARLMANADLLNELRDVYDAANRNNTAIYALDPRGLTPFEFDINQSVGLETDRVALQATLDTLRILADETDGRAIINQNDLATGLKQILRDSSAYYLLGYNSTRTTADGKFHEIKVRVKRPGVQVRSRKGYWAYTAEDAARATAPPRPEPPAAVTRALASIVEPPSGRLIRSWVGTSRGTNGRTRVTFVWEPLPPTPGTERYQPAQVSLLAVGAGDRSVFRGRVPEQPDASAPLAAGSRASLPAAAKGARVSFEVPPGPLDLRISVLRGASEVVDTETRSIQAPDYTAPAVAISTPAVWRATTARDVQDLKRDPTAVPTASRAFRRTERLIVRFEVYGPGDSQPAVTCRILNRDGGPMSDVPVAPPSEGSTYEIEIPLASFAVGEYVVEIAARGTESTAAELLPFRIVG